VVDEDDRDQDSAKRERGEMIVWNAGPFKLSDKESDLQVSD
jgi:hypothetical protein